MQSYTVPTPRQSSNDLSEMEAGAGTPAPILIPVERGLTEDHEESDSDIALARAKRWLVHLIYIQKMMLPFTIFEVMLPRFPVATLGIKVAATVIGYRLYTQRYPKMTNSNVTIHMVHSLCSVFAFAIAALFNVGEVLSTSVTMFKVLSAASVLHSLAMVITDLGIFIECLWLIALEVDLFELMHFTVLYICDSYDVLLGLMRHT